jgi:hypothetical protein
MPAYTDSLGFNRGDRAVDWTGSSRRSLQQVDLDFAAIAAARLTAGATALASTDTLEIILVKPGNFVRLLGWELVRAEGAAATLSIGDAAAAAGYGPAVDLNGTPGWFNNPLVLTEGAPNTFAAYFGGKVYPGVANSAVRATLNQNSIDLARVILWFEVADLTRL